MTAHAAKKTNGWAKTAHPVSFFHRPFLNEGKEPTHKMQKRLARKNRKKQGDRP